MCKEGINIDGTDGSSLISFELTDPHTVREKCSHSVLEGHQVVSGRAGHLD